MDSQRKGVSDDGGETVESGRILQAPDGRGDSGNHGGNELPGLAGDGVRGGGGNPAGQLGGLAGNPKPEPSGGAAGGSGVVAEAGAIGRLLARLREQQAEISATLDRIRRNLS